MKNFRLVLAASALCVSTVISVSMSAHAEELLQSTAASQLSVTQGFNQSSLQVLRRTATTDAAKVSAALTAKLCSRKCSTTSTIDEHNNLHISGDHWSLQVEADGSAAEFQDHKVEARAHTLGKDPSQKMSPDDLERSALDLIQTKLSSVILLGPDEELFPVRTAYRTEWGQDIVTGETHTAVVANRVVFGRKLRGVPVVGGGSTLVVTFTNDGAVESFRYDWPTYETTKGQAVVDAGSILRRVQQVVEARPGAPRADLSVKVPTNESNPYPVVLAASTTLEDLQCGYYDSGFAARDTKAPVQPGCVYHVLFQGNDGMRSGFAGAVPGGTRVESDLTWRESQIFGGR